MKRKLTIFVIAACALLFAAGTTIKVGTIKFEDATTQTTAGAQPGSACGANQFVNQISASGPPSCGTPSGSGTVTSFSSGNLSPLFTTSVTNPTTTPALSFSLSNANANAFLAGPTSGGAGAPTYRAHVPLDLTMTSGGDTIFDNAGAIGNLAIGAAGTTYRVNAGATAPSWDTERIIGRVKRQASSSFVPTTTLATAPLSGNYANFASMAVVSACPAGTGNALVEIYWTDEGGGIQNEQLSALSNLQIGSGSFLDNIVDTINIGNAASIKYSINLNQCNFGAFTCTLGGTASCPGGVVTCSAGSPTCAGGGTASCVQGTGGNQGQTTTFNGLCLTGTNATYSFYWTLKEMN